MAWTSPATPVAGTAITVAFYGTNIKDNLNWLRALTGGGFDPTMAGQVLLSTGVAATVWTQSPTIAGNVTISGTGAISSSLTVGGNLSVGGSVLTSLTMASTMRLRFPNEDGFKIDLTSSGDTTGIGKDATAALYFKASGEMQWRDGSGNTRMSLTVGATPVLAVGSNTVATLNSANFTTLQQGGNTVITTATLPATYGVTSTYTGDGGSSARQITTGFVPKLVIVTGGTSNANLGNLHIHSSSGCLYQDNAGNIAWDTTSGRLHGSDGFTVANGSTRGNSSGVVYAYTAFR
jgi:hypothetical protein